MNKPAIKFVRFLGWLIFLFGSLFTIVCFLTFITDKNVTVGIRIGGFIFTAVLGAVAFLGFRLLRFRKKQETQESLTQPAPENQVIDTPPPVAKKPKPATPPKKKSPKIDTPPITGKGIYRIVYIDGEGSTTERDIKIIRLEPDEPAKIYAYCFLREENRSFRIDRIVAMYKDGEPIKKPKKYLMGLTTEQLATEALE